jgi:(E)-4-hydroxy-3-methylbut-2-enyl-diphosphate synthase
MTRRVWVGRVPIGDGAPIAIQSMTSTATSDVVATLGQIRALEAAGCEIVRLAVPNKASADALCLIREQTEIPLVADIHFDPQLALAAIAAGVDKLRLNPGNITREDDILRVVDAAADAGIPLRVGANSGSLAPRYLDANGRASVRGMVDSALEEVRLLERHGFDQIVISLKATDVSLTVEAYRAVAKAVDYPLHVGITEAGGPWEGAIRSAVGLGILLHEGIGDTVRVSLTGDPVQEVRTAYEILKSLGLRRRGVDLHVCPTCGRTGIDLAAIAEQVRQELMDWPSPVSVALMGCIVNGLGEVRHADIGLIGGEGVGSLYVRGTCVEPNLPQRVLAERIVQAVQSLAVAEVSRDDI